MAIQTNWMAIVHHGYMDLASAHEGCALGLPEVPSKSATLSASSAAQELLMSGTTIFQTLSQESVMFRSKPVRFIAALLVLGGLGLPRAHAESKDMIQLQTQVQQLINDIARLQQSNDERMGVLKDLVQQTADSMNKMVVAIDGLKLQVQNVQDASAAKSDQLAGQIQSLNDSLDELKVRLTRVDKSLTDIQSQQQSTAALLTNLPTAGSPVPAAAGSPGSTDAPQPTAQPAPTPMAPVTRTPRSAPADAAPPAAADAPPPVGEMYRTAYSDFIGAKYPLAAAEFGDLIKAYPDDNLAGNAYFYIGEIDVRSQKLTAAVKSYDQVLERYPDNSKIPAAHLHKAQAMLAMKQTEGAVRELRALIQRFPASAEASQARSKLNQMGVRIVPVTP
jgi:tol-pal system protein YbgF